MSVSIHPSLPGANAPSFAGLCLVYLSSKWLSSVLVWFSEFLSYPLIHPWSRGWIPKTEEQGWGDAALRIPRAFRVGISPPSLGVKGLADGSVLVLESELHLWLWERWCVVAQ